MNVAPTSSRFIAYLLLTASMALVGTYVALSKPLVAVIPVFALTFLRFAIAAPAMLPWTLRIAGESPLTRTEHRLFFLVSFFGNFLFSICMLTGIMLTTATAAGVILATLPAVVALLSRWILRETLTPRAWLAIGLAVVGIALLQWAKSPDPVSTLGLPPAPRLGNWLMLGAVFCEAIYVIIAKRLSATRAPLRVSALTNLWGLALIAPLGLWQLVDFEFEVLTMNLWLLLIFYSLAASLFAVWMWVAGLKHVAASHAGVFTVALPIAATLVGVFLLGETFTWLQAAALACASAGIFLIGAAPRAAQSSRVQ
ncbi:MAG TPA: DMT family transporter [Burkholderiaceae bacterium]|nr:DMT family transporter [Burkholderiaceae bacterium]